MSGHQGWADLPDVLLHSIVALLGSFSDLLAFAATCRSWCDALSSYPFKSTFSTLFPPLLLQPDVTVGSPRIPPKFGDKYPRRVFDLASQHSRLCSQIPLVNLYGVLVFHRHNYRATSTPRSTTVPSRLPYGHPTHISLSPTDPTVSSGVLLVILG